MGGIARANQRELERFNRYWRDLLETFPEARAHAVAEMGRAAKQELDGRILSQGVDDAMGHIRADQQLRLGSLGGYAAITPGREDFVDRRGKVKTWNGKPVTSRQVTRWLERGHNASTTNSGSDKLIYAYGRKEGSFFVVPGRQFYSFTKLKAFDLAMRAAREVLYKFSDEVDY